MIRQLTDAEAPAFLDRIRADYLQNPYIFIDTLTLGLDTEQTSAWIVETDRFLGYIFRYYSSIQLFSAREPGCTEQFAAETAAYLSDHCFDMISGSVSCLREIFPHLKGYRMTEGVIMAQHHAAEQSFGIESAALSDCDEIAELICSDVSIGGHYRKEELSAQLKGRMLHEHCRNLVIRENGRIIAHFATYAETDAFAILGGLITTPTCRGKGCGAALQAQLASTLLQEGKLPLLYCYRPETQAWYERRGWEAVQGCAKLERDHSMEMLNFTVGPVMSSEDVIEVANHSTPYFRTPEFSALMQENEKLMLEYLHAPDRSRCVFLTASGTGAMESMVMNILNDRDRVLIVNGGSFGQRFVDLCTLHRRNFTELLLPFGQTLTRDDLLPYSGKGYTAFLVNMHETSSGVLYDMPMIAEFCRQNGMLLLVDAISAFLADELDMEALGAAAVITGSQKALAVQPGISVVALAPAALRRVEDNPEFCMYLSLKEALKNGIRGQTPFTPAVTTLLQIHRRLLQIREGGGPAAELARIAGIAAAFRQGIQDLPFGLVASTPSNAVTSLMAPKNNAEQIIQILKDEFKIWVCPNGGAYKASVFRVGHIGYITDTQNQRLLDALHSLNRRGIL